MVTRIRAQFLVHDWHWILTKAWSMKLIGLASVLSGAEVAIQFMAPRRPSPWFALAAAGVTIAAGAARLVCQRRPA